MELKDVHVLLNDQPVLRSINFSWAKGKCIAIIGANGAGKTTLLKVISQLIKPTSGEIQTAGLNEKEWKRRLGLVFPASFLYEDLTALENLVFYQKLYDRKNEGHLLDLLEEVNLLPVKDEPVHTFSKGMKQRLSIARALVHEPDYLILDEPFDGLDLQSKKTLEYLLEKRRNHGVGYLLVSHDVRHAFELCEKAVLLNSGRIVHEAPCTSEGYIDFMERYSLLLNGESA